MYAQVECPICMDDIELNKNCVSTECGHTFHASCLMKSVAHNGFGCPCCRTVMAEEPKEDDIDWTDEDDEEEEVFDDDALRGFRMFFNNLNGEPHDSEDEDDEQEMEENTASVGTEEDPSIPTTDFVAQKLKDQGVTFEQLVKIICEYDHEEYEDDEVAERLGSELFGKIRIIVSNYTPEQAITQVSRVTVATGPEVDFESQPKTGSVRSFHRINIHV